MFVALLQLVFFFSTKKMLFARFLPFCFAFAQFESSYFISAFIFIESQLIAIFIGFHGFCRTVRSINFLCYCLELFLPRLLIFLGCIKIKLVFSLNEAKYQELDIKKKKITIIFEYDFQSVFKFHKMKLRLRNCLARWLFSGFAVILFFFFVSHVRVDTSCLLALRLTIEN